MTIVAWLIVALVTLPFLAEFVARMACHRTWSGLKAELASWWSGE